MKTLQELQAVDPTMTQADFDNVFGTPSDPVAAVVPNPVAIPDPVVTDLTPSVVVPPVVIEPAPAKTYTEDDFKAMQGRFQAEQERANHAKQLADLNHERAERLMAEKATSEQRIKDADLERIKLSEELKRAKTPAYQMPADIRERMEPEVATYFEKLLGGVVNQPTAVPDVDSIVAARMKEFEASQTVKSQAAAAAARETEFIGGLRKVSEPFMKDGGKAFFAWASSQGEGVDILVSNLISAHSVENLNVIKKHTDKWEASLQGAGTTQLVNTAGKPAASTSVPVGSVTRDSILKKVDELLQSGKLAEAKKLSATL